MYLWRGLKSSPKKFEELETLVCKAEKRGVVVGECKGNRCIAHEGEQRDEPSRAGVIIVVHMIEAKRKERSGEEAFVDRFEDHVAASTRHFVDPTRCIMGLALGTNEPSLDRFEGSAPADIPELIRESFAIGKRFKSCYQFFCEKMEQVLTDSEVDHVFLEKRESVLRTIRRDDLDPEVAQAS